MNSRKEGSFRSLRMNSASSRVRRRRIRRGVSATTTIGQLTLREERSAASQLACRGDDNFRAIALDVMTAGVHIHVSRSGERSGDVVLQMNCLDPPRLT